MAASFEGKEFTTYRTINNAVTATKTAIPALGPHDILVRITHTGVCLTDALWSASGAPLALGHEGVGIVEAIGSAVTQFKVGERAGGGFHRNSCGSCNYCLTGRDILCYERVIFGESDFDNGTFGQYYIGHETYLHRIPDAMSSADAAPLQCAGATVYSALRVTVKPGDRVGVVGIGGLGHLAIQFATKLGAETVAISTSADKEKDARDFGASEFVLLGEMEKIKAPLNAIVLTGSGYPDWAKVLNKNILARDGFIVPLSAPVHGPLTLPAEPMCFDVCHVHSGLVASRAEHDEMLAFAARNGVKPTVQVFKHNGEETVKEVFDKLFQNKVRYRAVLEV